jgi:hypothetical protein
LAAFTAQVVLAEIAESLQETKELVAVGRVEFRVEGVLIHSFRQHLRDIPLNVIGDAPPDLWLAAESLIALEQISHCLHDINFERYA